MGQSRMPAAALTALWGWAPAAGDSQEDEGFILSSKVFPRSEGPVPDEQAHQRLLGRTPVVEDPMAELAKGVTPAVPCPNCGRTVIGVVGGEPEYALPPGAEEYYLHGQAPVVEMLLRRYTYRVAPCDCRVSLEWAGAFHAEVVRRKNGGAARPVEALTDWERDDRAAVAIRGVAQVAGRTHFEHGAEARRTLEAALSILYDYIVRIKPQAGDAVAAVVSSVSAATKSWADAVGLCRPGVPFAGFPEAVPPPLPVVEAPKVVPAPAMISASVPGLVGAEPPPKSPGLAFARKPRKVLRRKRDEGSGRPQGGIV